MAKLWHNIKNNIGSALVTFDEWNAKTNKAIEDPSVQKMGQDFMLGGLIRGTLGTFEKDSTPAPTTAQASKVNAEAIIDAQKKTVKNDNTIANSLGASMGNGPTSGVIGVGNNAQFTMMEQQLDTLKEIRDSIDRLGTPGYMNTDFTKSEYPTV
jgi:hypothetical protein